MKRLRVKLFAADLYVPLIEMVIVALVYSISPISINTKNKRHLYCYQFQRIRSGTGSVDSTIAEVSKLSRSVVSLDTVNWAPACVLVLWTLDACQKDISRWFAIPIEVECLDIIHFIAVLYCFSFFTLIIIWVFCVFPFYSISIWSLWSWF